MPIRGFSGWLGVARCGAVEGGHVMSERGGCWDWELKCTTSSIVKRQDYTMNTDYLSKYEFINQPQQR